MLVRNAEFDRDDPLYEINKILEASYRPGQVLWRPQVDDGEPAPDAVVFFQEHSRLAAMFLPGIYAIEDTNWKAMDSSGGVAMPNPIAQAWRAGEVIRETIKEHKRKGAYVIPVLVFINMGENADILEALGKRQVKILWGSHDLVDRLVALPEEHQLQPHLNADLIEQEIAALSQPPPASGSEVAPASPAPMPDGPSDLSGLDLANRPVIMHHVDTVHINIVVQGNGGGESPPFNISD